MASIQPMHGKKLNAMPIALKNSERLPKPLDTSEAVGVSFLRAECCSTVAAARAAFGSSITSGKTSTTSGNTSTTGSATGNTSSTASTSGGFSNGEVGSTMIVSIGVVIG
jgi:hypothetical protein